MPSRQKLKIADIKIDQFSNKGNGLGSYLSPCNQSIAAEVPFTIPGEYVKANLFKKRKGAYQGKLLEILSPSSRRIASRCIHFGMCGGCRWQHLSYEDQLVEKESFIKKEFSSLITDEVTYYPIIPCEDPWQYRNKMEFSFSSNQAGEKFLGLMLDSSKGKVLNLTECHLVNSWFVETLKEVRNWWQESPLEAYHPHKNTGTLRTLTLREGMRSGDRLAMLTVSGDPEYAIHQSQLKAFTQAIRKCSQPLNKHDQLSIFLRIHQAIKGKPTEFYEMQLYGPDTITETLRIQKDLDSSPEELSFSISPSAFFQPNTLQAEKIYSLVLQLASIPKSAVVYDLYCGTGTLGICMAKHVKEVIGVELSKESSHDAKENIKRNGLSNVRIINGCVGEVLKQAYSDPNFPRPDVVIVDPPRAGLDPQAIQLLLSFMPPQIVYVSCNPASQAKNIEELIKGGYTLKCLQPVDQFPQTVHVENIAVLDATI